MKKDITFSVDSDFYEKFRIATDLAKDDENTAIEKCMRWYVSKNFGEIADYYSEAEKSKTNSTDRSDNYGMANWKIPRWGMNPGQYNHKIMRAYFHLEKKNGEVLLHNLKLLCSDSTHPETYVPTFNSNYAQMKFDGPRSHGKVFEEQGDRIVIWNEVKETLMKYKHLFI